jgi:hypothetical protein
MDIQMYLLHGYKRDLDEKVKKMVSESHSEIDEVYWRYHVYTDEQRDQLENLNIFAEQMNGQRFGYFDENGEVVGGVIKSSNWDDAKIVITFNLKLDNEPESDIEYSANAYSGLSINGNTIIITDDGCIIPFGEDVPANSFRVTL